MSTYPHILTEQITKLAESSPEQFHDTLVSLAEDVLRNYNLDRLSLFPNSPLLVSRGDFFSVSLIEDNKFSYERYHADDFSQYIRQFKHVDTYRLFNHFDLLCTNCRPLRLLREEGVKFHGVIPVSAHGKVWGTLSVSSFHYLNFNWENSKAFLELKAIGNMWLSFWQQVCALQAQEQSCSQFLIKEKEKLLALSSKQLEVLKFLGKGLTAQECAEKMFISRRTVESHKYRILRILGVKTHTELVQLIKRHNISPN